MDTLTCPHCGTKNGYAARYCKECGTKMPRSTSGSDGWVFLILIALVLAFGGYAYSRGYRLKDVPTLLNIWTPNQTTEPAASAAESRADSEIIETTPVAPLSAEDPNNENASMAVEPMMEAPAYEQQSEATPPIEEPIDLPPSLL